MQGEREKNYPFKQSVEKREEEEVFVFFLLSIHMWTQKERVRDDVSMQMHIHAFINILHLLR